MKNRLLLILILLLTCIGMTGCWDNMEIAKRNVVTAIGLDKAPEKGKIVLTLQLVLPDKLSSPSKPTFTEKAAVSTVSYTGESINDAIRYFRTQESKIPLFQHSRILIIGEDLAKDGIQPIMDYFFRNIEIKPQMQVWVCPGKASAILNWQSEVSKIPANYIIELSKARTETSSNYNIDVHNFLVGLSEKATSLVTGKIEIVKPEENKPSVPDISGLAVFKQDKLVGWLDIYEERGFLFIVNKFNRANVEIGYPQSDSPKINMNIRKSKTKLKPEINDSEIMFSLEVKVEGIIDQNNALADLSSQEVIRDIEKKMDDSIRKDIEACLMKAQKEYSSDIFGFGEAIHRKYPKEWKNIKENWEQIFSDVPVSVKVTTKIRGMGLNIEPIIN